MEGYLTDVIVRASKIESLESITQTAIAARHMTLWQIENVLDSL